MDSKSEQEMVRQFANYELYKTMMDYMALTDQQPKNIYCMETRKRDRRKNYRNIRAMQVYGYEIDWTFLHQKYGYGERFHRMAAKVQGTEPFRLPRKIKKEMHKIYKQKIIGGYRNGKWTSRALNVARRYNFR